MISLSMKISYILHLYLQISKISILYFAFAYNIIMHKKNKYLSVPDVCLSLSFFLSLSLFISLSSVFSENKIQRSLCIIKNVIYENKYLHNGVSKDTEYKINNCCNHPRFLFTYYPKVTIR